MTSTVDQLLARYPVVVTQSVVWGDMDSYRHVNNVVYFRYFENARLEYFRRMGWLEHEKEIGVGPILAATQARFRRPLNYPDTISIGARVESIVEDRFFLDHIIVSHAHSIITTKGKGEIVTFDYTQHRKVSVPETVRRWIEQLEATVKP